MMASLFLTITFCIVLGFSVSAAPSPNSFAPASDSTTWPQVHIVELAPNSTLSEASTFINTVCRSVTSQKSLCVLHSVAIGPNFKAVSAFFPSATALAAVKAASFVVHVERQAVGRVAASQSRAPWGLVRISAREKPKYTSPFVHGDDATGAGVTAYVVDSGIEINHPDLGGRAVRGWKANKTLKDGDYHGHGTSVAGVIAGEWAGVAKAARIVDVKLLDDKGEGTTDDLIRAIEYLAPKCKQHGHRGHVINMSLGFTTSRAVDRAVKVAVEDFGCNIFVAAGNEGVPACTLTPASASLQADIVVVGATDRNDHFAQAKDWSSNHGKCVTILAPGEKVHTITIGGGKTKDISGTSLATPYVAGTAAAYLSSVQYKGTSPSQLKRALLNQATVDMITGVPPDTPNLLVHLGI